MRYVTDVQIAFARRLSLDIAGKSVGEAEAMILDVIRRDFRGVEDLGLHSAYRGRNLA
jgi:hypothetical protein